MEKKYRAIMIYGSFDDPYSNSNFFVLRIPMGRIPWCTKIVPAIDKYVNSLFTVEEHKLNKKRRKYGPEPLIYWNVGGLECEGFEITHPDSLWNTKLQSKYEWDGSKIVLVKPGVAQSG